MRALPFLSLASFVLVACSSADFEVSNGQGSDSGTSGDTITSGDSSNPTDSGIGGDSGGGDAPRDSNVVDSGGSGDGISSDGTSGCGTLAATANNVYVDNASSQPSVGTTACPFHTIYEASSLTWIPATGHRTIHVAAGTYTETHAVVIGPAVVVAGAGVGVTDVTGGGSCSGSANCVIEVGGGAVVHDLTVIGATSTHAIVTDSFGGSLSAPLVHNVAANGAGGVLAGILARGAADIGPNVALTGNGRGLDSVGSGTVHIIGGASPAPADNVISGNSLSGIHMEGSSMLLIDSADVHDNGTNGIDFVGTGGVHTLRSLLVHANGQDGIVVTSDCSLYVRNSAFYGNNFGIRFVKTGTNTLDLGGGPTATTGGNTFAGTSVASLNRSGGICVNLTAVPTYVVPAQDDSWSSCPDPGVAHVTACDATGGYDDIWIAVTGGGTGATPDTTGCLVGL
jgi:hypothetical protein